MYFKGSKIFLPLLKGIHTVNGLWNLIHAKVPIMQDATGKVAWVYLSKLVLELVEDQRKMGYLKERAGLVTDLSCGCIGAQMQLNICPGSRQ